MSLAAHVRTLGRGPGRSRSLTLEEARDAMSQMLSGSAAPEAVGALLMLLRMKGEAPEEIAGFAHAAAQAVPALPHVDLDWPSYSAGRTRGQPWFLLSARLVAQAGHRVLLHGWNGPDRTVRTGLANTGITIAKSIDEAARALDRDRITYIPLETLSPALFGLLNLRDRLGLRSCINTICRMLNPAGATASVQGVFHPSYRLLQSEAAALLDWEALSVVKGAGGEFERNPSKEITAFGLRDGQRWNDTLSPIRAETRRMSESTPPSVADLWHGKKTPAFETDVITGTTELALDTLGDRDAAARAQLLWQTRTDRRAA